MDAEPSPVPPPPAAGTVPRPVHVQPETVAAPQAPAMPVPAAQPAGLPRWGQLSYASFDPGHGARGGWQFKERSGGLLEQELASLQSRIVTQFDPVVPPNDFPGTAEIAAMPRRFTHVRGESGQGHYWHAVMAGMDTTGRPGNVFSHVLVDRRPAAENPTFRPVQWWDSPDLLRPYGMEQVMAARLPEFTGGAFAPGLDAASVLDFLFAPNVWRAGVLAVLLDAVAAAMGGGPGVVLVTDSAHSAALWTAAVSFLCSPHLARQLNFSLFERAGSLETVFSRGIHLACIPRDDVPALDSDGAYVVLDESETPNMGDVGGNPHTTAAGSSIAATYWGTLAQDAVASRETARETMAELDLISGRLGDMGTDPGWPLAMAAVRKPDIFADAAAEAVVVLKASSPPSLRKDPELLAQALTAVNASGSDHAEDAWNELFNGTASALVRETLVQTYVERALTDVAWLERPGPVPLPGDWSPEVNTPALQGVARSTVLALRSRLAERSSRESVLAAPGVLDFIASSELLDFTADGDTELADATEEILERVVGAVIDYDDEAQALTDFTGAFRSTAVLRKFLAGVARTSRFEQSMPGMRMPAVFREWLFPGLPQGEVSQELGRGAMKLDPMVVEVALWLCQLGRGSADKARVVAAIGLSETFVRTPIPAGLARAVFHTGPAWSGEELWTVEERCPRELPGGLFHGALLEEAWSPGLDELCKLMGRRGLQDITPLESELAELRRAAEQLAPDGTTLAHAWTQGSSEAVQHMARMFLQTLDSALAPLGRRLHSENVESLMVVAAVIAMGSEKGFGPWPETLQKELGRLGHLRDPGVARALAGCVDSDVLSIADAEHLGRVALHIQPGFSATAAAEQFMAGIRVTLDGAEVPVLEVPLRRVLASKPLFDLDVSAATTMQVLEESSPPAESERHREKALQERQKLFMAWWEQLCVATGRVAAGQERNAFFDSFKSFKSVLWKDR